MDRYDALLALGVLLIALGAGLAWLPLGLICGGAGCCAIAAIGARAAAERTAAAKEKQ